MLEPAEQEPSPPLGRRARKALATRRALFGAGLAAFEHRPLGVVSVLDITEASDVAKGVFYLHFAGKDDYLIELWKFVQEGFLRELRERIAPCRARRARIDAAVACHHRLLAAAPRECRFWLRMSSYFGDEIGQPGQMSRLRRDYLRSLAALLAGGRTEDEGGTTLQSATVLDATCWGLISHSVQHGAPALTQDELARAVAGAIRALGRD